MATKSKYRELADEEAARAEAEPDEDADAEPDDAEPDDAEPDDEEADEHAGEPEAVFEPLSAEAFAEALEAEGNRHIAALRAIFGPTFDEFEECGLCHLLGVVTPESMVLDPTTQRCGRCKGWGVLVTEAVNEQNVTRQCPDCMGNGYVPRMEAPVEQAPPPPVQIPPMPVLNPITNQWEVPTAPAGGYVPPATTPGFPS